MASSPWKNAALSALLATAWTVPPLASGQRVIFVPSATLVRSPVLPLGLGPGAPSPVADDEPPCRRARLEPWRRRVREACAAEVVARCSRRGGGVAAVPTSSMFSSPLYREMDMLLREMTMGGPASRGGPLPGSFFLRGGVEREEESIESVVDGLMRSSLRMFDEMMSSVAEDAAEGALDVMVASLARASASASSDWDEAEDEPDEVSPSSDEFRRVPLPLSLLPSPDEFLDELSRAGQDLLADAATRRRLSEGIEDPRQRARERIARRLTEYRRDVFFSPDGTVTIYTRSSLPPAAPPAFVARQPPAFGGRPYVLPLGMGEADGCLRDEYDGLGEGCRGAIGDLLDAVEDRAKASPDVVIGSILIARAGPHRALVHVWIVMLALLALSMLWECCLAPDDDDEEEDYEEEADEFDYGRIPEGEEGEQRVFVGVPVQVV